MARILSRTAEPYRTDYGRGFAGTVTWWIGPIGLPFGTFQTCPHSRHR
ncbi:MAG: hypothetical protein ABI634_10825 [Acidobacteriota bacterium]